MRFGGFADGMARTCVFLLFSNLLWSKLAAFIHRWTLTPPGIPPQTGLIPESWTGLIVSDYGCKGPTPTLHGRQAFDPLLDSVVVVPVDIPVNSPGELVDTHKMLTVIHFCFQISEEILHNSIVETVIFTRHGPDCTGVLDEPTPAGMLILETSVGVHNQLFPQG